MRATLEPVVFVLRVHPNGEGTKPDTPYCAAATVVVDELGTATIKGLVSSEFGVSAWRAIFEALDRAGIVEVIYTRRAHGTKTRLIRRRAPHVPDATQ